MIHSQNRVPKIFVDEFSLPEREGLPRVPCEGTRSRHLENLNPQVFWVPIVHAPTDPAFMSFRPLITITSSRHIHIVIRGNHVEGVPASLGRHATWDRKRPLKGTLRWGERGAQEVIQMLGRAK